MKSDPKLDALLDEVLAPEAAPAGMVDAIVEATNASVRRLQPAVLARIHRTRRLRHLAAAVILAMEAGIWATLLGIASDARSLARLESDLHYLDQLAHATAPIDTEITLLSTGVDLAQGDDAWDAVTASVNQALDDWEGQLDNEPILF